MRHAKPMLVALGVLLAVGVGWSKGAPIPDTGTGTDQETNFDNVEMVGGSLKDRVEILRVGSEPSANNLLSVFVGLKNKTGRELVVEIETIYKDGEGKPLNSGSWVALTLKPHEEREYRSTSISETFDANTMNAPFLIRIRPARAAAHA